MKKLSLKQMILNRLKQMEGQWVHKGRIEERVKEWGYLAENGNRRCRELYEEGLIERKEERGSVSYRYAPNSEKYEKVVYSVPSLEKEIVQYKLI